MTTLILKNLPMDRKLDRETMAAVHGGNNGTGSAGASVPTTSAGTSVPTTSVGASVPTTSISRTNGTTNTSDSAALDLFFKLYGTANGDFDELFFPELFH